MLVVVMSLDVECCKDGRTFFTVSCGCCWICVPSLGTAFFLKGLEGRVI